MCVTCLPWRCSTNFTSCSSFCLIPTCVTLQEKPWVACAIALETHLQSPK